MKKMLFIFFLLLMYKGKSQSPVIVSSIQPSNPNFIKSVAIMDTLKTPTNYGEDTVKYIIYAGTNVIDSVGALKVGSNWQYIFDTGSLSDSANSIIADYYAGGSIVAISNNYSFTVLPKPDWLSHGGTYTVSAVNGDTVYMDAKYPLQINNQTLSGGVKFLEGKEFGFINNSFNFTAKYNMANKGGSSENPSFNCVVNAFNYNAPPFSLTPSSSGVDFNIGLDTSFNLDATVKFTNSRTLVDWESPDQSFSLPFAPIFKVRFGVGFKLDGGISGRLHYGYDSFTHSYGLIGNTSDTTASNIAVGTKLDGTLRGGIDLINKKICGVTGVLSATGRLGLEWRFVTKPTTQDSLLFGGDLQVTGTIKLQGVGSWIAKKFFGFEMYEGQIFPNTGSYAIGTGFPNDITFARYHLMNSYTNTYQASWEKDINYQTPSPNLDTRNASIKGVWLEEDSAAQIQYLYMTKYDTTQCGSFSFTPAKIVTSGGYNMSNPKISSFTNGDAIITWTQNKFNTSTLPSPYDSTNLINFINGQDIMFAIYQNSLDSIIYIDTLADPTGRKEGQATVTAGKGTNALITWLVEDTTATTTDIYYVKIDNTSGNWTSTNPRCLVNLSGNNFDVNVQYVDSVHAVAVWIHDADADDTTPNNEIVSYLLNDSTWIAMSPSVANTQPNVNYNDVSFDLNGQNAAVVYTAENNIDTGVVYKTVEVKFYDNNSDMWSASSMLIDGDTLTNFNLPSISLSDSGIVAVTYQSVNIFSDTIPEQGQLNLFINKFTNPNPQWQKIIQTDLQYLCDTNAYVWQMSASFGKNNILYILTQEMDTVVGNNYTPQNGTIFGDADLDMVLRNVQVNSNLTIQDAPSPCSTPTGIKTIGAENNVPYVRNFPNPASEYTIFEYIVKEQANVKIDIINLQGQLISTLVNELYQSGMYRTVFNIQNLANGVYLYKTSIGGYSIINKLLIAR